MSAVISNQRAVDLLLNSMDMKPRALRSTESPTHAPDERVAKFALSYLDAFGYLKNELNAWKDITLDDILNAIGHFQNMFGLKRSKALDVRTVRAMEAPRCGYPDIVRSRHAEVKSVARAAKANLAKWQKSGVTYTIAEYLPGMAKQDMEVIVRRAFDAWEAHGQINITRAASGDTPDIVISVGRGRQSNFDGPGGMLAWAYMPTESGSQLTAKFDLDEVWTLSDSQRGTRLYNVACHEFGHLLGLGHSKVPSALMAPYYNAAIGEPQPVDDIPRFQLRYGKRT